MYRSGPWLTARSAEYRRRQRAQLVKRLLAQRRDPAAQAHHKEGSKRSLSTVQACEALKVLGKVKNDRRRLQMVADYYVSSYIMIIIN